MTHPSLRNTARRPFLSLLALTVSGLLSLSACTGGDAAPPSTFVLIDGSSTSTEQLKGKVTLVNFWATTCVSCVKEMPMLAATYNKFQAKGYETIAVAMSHDQPAWVVNFAQTRQLPFKVAMDNTGELAKSWGEVRITPTSYLVDKQGRIVKRFVGEPDPAALHQLIEKLLADA